MKILLATGNDGKKRDMQYFFGNIAEFVSLKDFGFTDEPEENGKTFEANALIKAKYFAKKSGLPTIGEDSGFILNAHPGKFGLKTKREINAKDDHEWLKKFLDLVEVMEDRSAEFFSAMAFVDLENEVEFTCLGQTKGEMIDFPATPIEPGIPVSSVFIPEGEIDVFSAMLRKQRNEISHRGKSAKKMRKFLEQLG